MDWRTDQSMQYKRTLRTLKAEKVRLIFVSLGCQENKLLGLACVQFELAYHTITILKLWLSVRGGRYYRKKLSTADISEFFKLSANYRYRILGIWELSKNYRYRKLHPILSDKHNWKHCSKNKKGTTMINRKAACCQRLLVQQSQHRQFQCLWEVHWWC